MKVCGLLLILFCYFTSAAQQSSADINSDIKHTLYKTNANSISIANGYMWSAIASYQRVQRFSEHIGAIGRIGGGFTLESGFDLAVEAETSLIIGWSRSFIEAGVGYHYPFTPMSGFIYVPHVAYRYMGHKGFLLKLGYGYNNYTNQDEIEQWGSPEPTIILQVGYLIHLKR